MTNIAITGAAGRMGKTLVTTISETEGLKITAAIERPESSLIGADVGEVAGIGALGVPISADLNEVTDEFDVLIDFSVAEATVQNIEICAAKNKKMVIGTTGLDNQQVNRLQELSTSMAVVFAPNYSVGVNATFKLLEIAAQIFGDDVDIEITEAHHRNKVDAPSGTALKMGQILASTLDRDLDSVAIYGREGVTGVRDQKTIGFSTIRGGDIIGEHTVMFAATGERVEITHRAQSRSNFSQGAVRSALWVANQSAGLFDMQDVLQLKKISL
ncbi:MAG: 4-hydroxy-tetrahydrodipicolinate reductase [Pseudomonadales bacterium]|nr:4-hydroxy-tetrahydrodipicolinate reductase [Pseudomonadales bacterium]